MANKQFFETTGRFVDLPESCEGCGECCKNFATLVDIHGAEFFTTTSAQTVEVLVSPVQIRSKLSKNEKQARIASALATNLGIREESTIVGEIAKGDGLVVIHGRCGNLTQDDRCAMYDVRPNRPCREVIMGSYSCLHALDIAQNPRLQNEY
jgi:Fe-S-cluster containining protein